MAGQAGATDNSTITSPYADSSAYDQIFGNVNQYWQNANKTKTTLDQYGTDFAQQFQNAVGRPPTAAEINQFYSQAVSPVINTQAGFSGTDPNAVVQQYVPQAFQSQIKQNQQDQATKQMQDLSSQENQSLQGNIQTVENQIPGITQNVTDSFMNGPGYQSLLGSLNNSGILNSGATSAAAGNTIGQGVNAQIAPLISGLVGGATGQIQNNPQQGFDLGTGNVQNYNMMGQNAGAGLSNQNNQLYDFMLQSQLGKQLAAESQPSGAQGILGMATGAAGGAGGLLQGGSSAYNATQSYVCREMKKRGLLCESDLEDFYLHMFDAVWYKARAFWHYKVNGQKLVDAVNAKGLDWKVFKPLLFDRVMDEPDSCKANDLFADACHQLCISAAPHLWDSRVLRTSFWDSLPFIPLLFTDATFGKNFWRILRIKTLIIYDKPRCGVHR